MNREEGRIALTSLLQPSDRDGDGGPLETGVSEDVHSTSFLDTSLPTRATRLRRKAASGVCCGMKSVRQTYVAPARKIVDAMLRFI